MTSDHSVFGGNYAVVFSNCAYRTRSDGLMIPTTSEEFLTEVYIVVMFIVERVVSKIERINLK